MECGCGGRREGVVSGVCVWWEEGGCSEWSVGVVGGGRV